MVSKNASNRILVKVKVGGESFWICVCHINEEIYAAFRKATNTKRKQFVKWLIKWTEEDFNWSVDYTEPNHLQLLNELVIDRYKKVYPHMYYNNVIAESKLIRSWVSEKMAKEIRKYDKPTYNRLFNSTSDSGGRL